MAERRKMTRAEFAAAAVVLALIIALAVHFTGGTGGSQKNKMSSVYGKSFTTLPHTPLQSHALERVTLGSGVPGPSYQFHPQRVAGASFSRM